jgi:hypothetical protein
MTSNSGRGADDAAAAHEQNEMSARLTAVIESAGRLVDDRTRLFEIALTIEAADRGELAPETAWAIARSWATSIAGPAGDASDRGWADDPPF